MWSTTLRSPSIVRGAMWRWEYIDLSCVGTSEIGPCEVVATTVYEAVKDWRTVCSVIYAIAVCVHFGTSTASMRDSQDFFTHGGLVSLRTSC